MADTPVMGIDLGTTNSCVAIWRNKEVLIVRNKNNDTTTPSCIAFTENGLVVGKSAVVQQTINPKNTIFEIKRVIGRNDKEIKKEADFFPFSMVKDENNKPQCEVNVEGESIRLYPEEISAIVLKNLKESAESLVNQKVIQKMNLNHFILFN